MQYMVYISQLVYTIYTNMDYMDDMKCSYTPRIFHAVIWCI